MKSGPYAGFDPVRDIMRDAGRLAAEWVRRRDELAMRAKASPLDFVTQADIVIESAVRERLAERFPDDRFWGEESGRPDAPDCGRVWICDPIDGTRSFVRFGHDYCVSLGLLIDGRIDAAWIFDPERDDLYEAKSGRGAFLNGRRLGLQTLPGLDHALVGLGYSERVDPDRHAAAVGGILRAGAMCHQHGSGALALAQTAAGRLDAYVELHQNAWDALPGLLIAEEAGALCLSWRPRDLLSGGLTLAANAGIALSLAAIVNETPNWGVTNPSRHKEMTLSHS